MIREERDGKKFLDQRSIQPKYVYLYKGEVYLNPRTLCDKLGLSFGYVRHHFTKGETGEFIKKIKITSNDEGYKNGKFKIDLDEFCKQIHLTKKDVLKAIKDKGSYQREIRIKRTSKYDFKLSYAIDGKYYPAKIL